MRSNARVSARSRKQAAVGVSLFPFLAVLICAMGALILLLVVIARGARVKAVQAAAAKASRKAADLKIEQEDIRWRISHLEASRETVREQLTESRLRLGHIEDHAQQLRRQLAHLKATWAELQRLQSDGGRRRELAKSELARLRSELATFQQQLADARTDAKHRKTYAVVPYRGSNQTHRRPIYIECRSEAIILQPEGITLTAADLEGRLGPGNPLAAALRATREHLLTHQDLDPETSGEPYPLLLIRPDGITAYYKAREAMKSWEWEFGYELIGEQWELDFQAPDPELAESVSEAVSAARVRQRRLAAAVPRKFHRAARGGGGIVPAGGSARFGYGRYRPDQASKAFANSSQGRDDGRNPRSEAGGAAKSPGHRSYRSGSERSSKTPWPEGSVAKRPAAETPRSSVAGSLPRPGIWQPGGQKSKQASSSLGQTGSHVRPLASIRGRDWGLPDASDGLTPVTRSIRVDCHHDRLVIVPEKGLARKRIIPLSANTESAVDEFVSAIWKYMDCWGIAGRNMYWRPILQVHVGPDGQERYAELSRLLEDSGLGVERHGERRMTNDHQ